VGCYLDFTDLVLSGEGGASLTTVTNGFFLGGAQVVFAANKPNASVSGVTIANNQNYDTGSPLLAVNETGGAYWGAVADLTVAGNVLQPGAPGSSVPAASKSAGGDEGCVDETTGSGASCVLDFSDVLLFPRVPIASYSVAIQGGDIQDGANVPVAAAAAAPPLGVKVWTVASGAPPPKPWRVVVAVDQSTRGNAF